VWNDTLTNLVNFSYHESGSLSGRSRCAESTVKHGHHAIEIVRSIQRSGVIFVNGLVAVPITGSSLQ
jgi:hypothetical protein